MTAVFRGTAAHQWRHVLVEIEGAVFFLSLTDGEGPSLCPHQQREEMTRSWPALREPDNPLPLSVCLCLWTWVCACVCVAHPGQALLLLLTTSQEDPQHSHSPPQMWRRGSSLGHWLQAGGASVTRSDPHLPPVHRPLLSSPLTRPYRQTFCFLPCASSRSSCLSGQRLLHDGGKVEQCLRLPHRPVLFFCICCETVFLARGLEPCVCWITMRQTLWEPLVLWQHTCRRGPSSIMNTLSDLPNVSLRMQPGGQAWPWDGRQVTASVIKLFIV